MCILTKYGIETETVLLFNSNSIFYVNQLENHQGESSEKQAPIMCFSFNGNLAKDPVIVQKKDLEAIIKIHRERYVIDEVQCDSGFSVNRTYSFGYEILTGTRHEVYCLGMSECSTEKERKALSSLVNPTIVHGENAVFAKPVKADNDWTGIYLEFDKPLDPTTTIVPTCHEWTPAGSWEYNQLIIVDGHFGDLRDKLVLGPKMTHRFFPYGEYYGNYSVNGQSGYFGKCPDIDVPIISASWKNNQFLKLDVEGENNNFLLSDIL